VHLVGFTTEIYHDARSHEGQIGKQSPREGAIYRGSEVDGIINRNTLFY